MADRARAFTVVEVLMAVALTAVLLTSIAVAVRSGIQSYTENERITSMTQAARFVLARMMRDVRTADEVDSTATSLTITPPDDGSGVTLIRYEVTGGSLTYHRVANGSPADEVLLGPGQAASVNNFQVDRQTFLQDEHVLTRSVRAQVTFAAGGRTMAVTASADVRRNQKY